jgi:hypothetical protein
LACQVALTQDPKPYNYRITTSSGIGFNIPMGFEGLDTDNYLGHRYGISFDFGRIAPYIETNSSDSYLIIINLDYHKTSFIFRPNDVTEQTPGLFDSYNITQDLEYISLSIGRRTYNSGSLFLEAHIRYNKLINRLDSDHRNAIIGEVEIDYSSDFDNLFSFEGNVGYETRIGNYFSFYLKAGFELWSISINDDEKTLFGFSIENGLLIPNLRTGISVQLR